VIRIRWTEQAVTNLEDIKSFISSDSPAYALAVVRKLYLAVDQLKAFPESGRIVLERADPDLRELVRPPYRIVYRRSGDVIEVLLVFRSSLPFPDTQR
jgi:plasmid stabilization system protein ParE